MADKYILELDRKEALMLGKIILMQRLYRSSYDPLQDLCHKVDNICFEINETSCGKNK